MTVIFISAFDESNNPHFVNLAYVSQVYLFERSMEKKWAVMARIKDSNLSNLVLAVYDTKKEAKENMEKVMLNFVPTPIKSGSLLKATIT